jgi:hypothetical protein
VFQGKTVFCVGSGPSLTRDDCAAVEASGHPIVAVNSSWKAARSAAVIFGGDQAWWDAYKSEIDIPAKLWTCSMSASMKYGLGLLKNPRRHWNSGLCAIELAEAEGADRIVLLGYDCSVRKGAHWHGDHAKTQNPTQSVCESWCGQFDQLARRTKIEIINCSRQTALKCFPRAELEEILCLTPFPEENLPKTNSSCAAS